MVRIKRLVAVLAATTAMAGASSLHAQTATAAKPLVSQAGSLTPNAGMIRAHIGEISPFWGDTRTYWNGTDPLGTDLTQFWGSLTPYAGMIRAHEGVISDMAGMIRAHEGDLAGMAGMIRAHLGEIGATAGMIRAHDGAGPGGTVNYAGALVNYRTFVAQSQAFWETAVAKATGSTFQAAFATPLLAKYGIDLNDPASLAKLTADSREMFFLDWNDGLMQYSGADQVDHWMHAIGWNPKITQQQGSGSRAIIGLVDFFVANDPDIKAKVVYSGGYTEYTGHGAGVASLILASHDGKGVMGIAPNARVAAYNPFDATRTASWADVTKAIPAVSKAGASVINLSLGVPGYTLHPEWRNVFKTSAVDTIKDRTLYVIAAGNSGTVQTSNVEMNGALDSTFLVVGSVSPAGTISSFSNQPGFVCLTDGGQCKNTQRADVGNTGDRFVKADYLKESGYLMNRFLVAPGELILVADGAGGVTRMSGTSFSTPLVSGAIALIHDRWPWLKNYPRDVAKVLLDSATDLGDPGADPVYGRGLLNVERAQSVLDFSQLKYQLWNGTTKKDVTVSTLRQSGLASLPTWSAANMYFAAFEKIDSAERDFLIPLSTRLFGTMKNGQYFQEFVYNHFVNWLSDTGSAAPGFAGFGFSNLRSVPVGLKVNDWSFSMSGRMVVDQFSGGRLSRPRLRSTMTVASPSNAFSFSAGSGDGAIALGNRLGLQTTSDFDATSGGVNPLLGFASDGGHINTTVKLSYDLSFSAGVTSQRLSQRRLLADVSDEQDRRLIGGAGRTTSSAVNVRMDYRPLDWLGLSASLTRLSEEGAFLGVRSLSTSDFGMGTITDGVTLQADVGVGAGVTLFGSVTGARSTGRDRDTAFRIADGGVIGTSFQFGVAKTRLLTQQDRLRLTLSQPLAIERGTIDFTSVMVIDRKTGEKGEVTQSFSLAQPNRRRAVAEMLYGTPLLDGRAELSLFGRGELLDLQANTPRLLIGGQASLAF